MEAADSTTNEAEQLLSAMDGARDRTLALIAGVADADLDRVIDPIMSPLAWDLGHIAAYEDLWLAHRGAGEDLLEPELASLYDAFETPRAVRGEVGTLDAPAALEYLGRVRERSRELALTRGAEPAEYWEMVLRHELQHSETMRQTMDLGDLLPAGEPALVPLAGELEWHVIAGGPFTMGANGSVFSYDNERPAHELTLAPYAIASRPANSGEWLSFAAAGGYERPELWSAEGWRWRSEQQIGPHPAIERADPETAACHVSLYEAEAFARHAGARLPSEAEWEKAARSDGEPLTGRGQVWEWTGSRFAGYPGFRAHPYREYSEVFFGDGYRVLRGSSWATDELVASDTFRNWDLPIRRQIFAGVRLAREL